MDHDEQTPRSPVEDEPTRRISLFEEGEHTRRLELPPTPPWDEPDRDPEPRAKRGKHVERSSGRWPIAVAAGLIGLALGAIAALLVSGGMLQQQIGERDARIMQLTSELDQARAEQRDVSAQLEELDRRAATLDQREQALDQREQALDQREQELSQREPVLEGRPPPPGIDLPDIDLDRGVLDRFGQRIQDLLDEAFPPRSSS